MSRDSVTRLPSARRSPRNLDDHLDAQQYKLSQMAAVLECIIGTMPEDLTGAAPARSALRVVLKGIAEVAENLDSVNLPRLRS